jgi:hypothetical protein
MEDGRWRNFAFTKAPVCPRKVKFDAESRRDRSGFTLFRRDKEYGMKNAD